MLKIRLTRTGKKHKPTYRIVVAEHTAPIQGRYVESVGYYLPTQNPKVLEVNKERVEYWMSKGAQATDTVHNLLVTKGILTEKRNIRYAKDKEDDTAPSAETNKTPAEATETPAQEPEAETEEPTASDAPSESNDQPAE